MLDPRISLALRGHTDSQGEMIREQMPRPAGCEAWEYIDLPWMPPLVYQTICAVAGHDDIVLIAGSSQHGLVRAQYFVSPPAAARLREYADATLS